MERRESSLSKGVADLVLVRSMPRDHVAVVLLLMLTGCQTSTPGTRYDALPKTTFVAHGQTYCTLHRVPLVTRHMFGAPSGMLVHYREQRCAECDDRFPNHIEPRYGPHRTSFRSEPSNVAYCPKCEAGFWKCAGDADCGRRT